MNFKSLFLLAVILTIGIYKSYGNDPLHFDGKSQMIFFNQSEQPSIDQLNSILKESGLAENYSLNLLNKESDLIGMLHFRYQETYHGNPIDGTMWIVHTKDGKIQSMNGVLVNNLPSSSQTSIDAKSAYATAFQFVVNSLPEKERNAKLLINDSPDSPELIWTSTINDLQNFRLCYRFDIFLREVSARKYVFVDVETGKVINFHERIQNINAPGTAITGYSGTQSITTDSNAGSYRLRETGRGNGVETYNLSQGEDYSMAVDFLDADNTWNNANANEDQYATDTHWGTEKTYDYYFLTYGRNSVDNAGFKLKSYVHYSYQYYNAFWDGAEMTYGDGDNTVTPLVTLDIIGHEISHGVTENTSNLYYSGESGALNEAYSDCIGTAIEFYGKPSTANWLIGSEIGTSFRDMSNPNAYGQPDTYNGTYWYSWNDVHTNSGVMNYWFYLLSQGGSGTNDIGNSFSVAGQTIAKAAAIAYRMNTVYLTSTSQYADARTYAIQAAIDLYGACSNEVIATTNAWYAVGVGAASTSVPLTSVITAGGPTSFCSGSNVVLTNTSTGLNYQWKKGNTNIAGATNINYVLTLTGNYTCVASNSCGAVSSNSIHVTVYALPTATVTLTGSNPFCSNSTVTLTANGGTGISYQWKRNNLNIAGATHQTLIVSTAGNYKVVVTKTATGCKKTSAIKSLSTISCREEMDAFNSEIFVYPNPFSNTVTLESKNNKTDRVEVIDVAGRIVETKSVGDNTSIQLGENLPSGFYVARLWNGNELIRNIKLVKTE